MNQVVQAWLNKANDLEILTRYAFAARYPGLEMDAEVARDCLASCDRVRSAVLKLLQLS